MQMQAIITHIFAWEPGLVRSLLILARNAVGAYHGGTIESQDGLRGDKNAISPCSKSPETIGIAGMHWIAYYLAGMQSPYGMLSSIAVMTFWRSSIQRVNPKSREIAVRIVGCPPPFDGIKMQVNWIFPRLLCPQQARLTEKPKIGFPAQPIVLQMQEQY